MVEDLATAERVIETDRRLRAITRDGDARGWGWATGGERKNRSEVEIRAVITAAEAAEKKALSRIEKAQAALQGPQKNWKSVGCRNSSTNRVGGIRHVNRYRYQRFGAAICGDAYCPPAATAAHG